MIATDGQLEQHRIQADEGGGEASRVAFLSGCATDECDRSEARGDGKGLQRPQPAGDPERRDRVAREREQGTVGRALEGPAHKQVDGIGGRLGGDVRVRIQPVQRAQAGEVEVAEDILGEQRGAEQQRHVRGEDRHPEHPS